MWYISENVFVELLLNVNLYLYMYIQLRLLYVFNIVH